ncbi:hypothetical protein FJY63_01370 [Candidatus Sumerlaeota bacterium]|nr:hypothetical protein [Candidatus Sumerlaeota bacterium]
MAVVVIMQGLSPVSAGEKPVHLALPAEIEGWKITTPESRQVTPKTIFDYMNGAGELFLAYDFRALYVWKYERPDHQPITVEAYEMGSPEEAFGVLSNDLDGENVGVGQHSVYGAGLLRFWQGRWFFSVLVELETSESRRAVLTLGRVLEAQVAREGERPRLLARLPSQGLVPESVHYFHTRICLNSYYFFAVENLLELDQKTDAVMGEYRFGKQRAGLLIICYPTSGAATKAHAHFRDRYMGGLEISPKPLEMARLENGEWVGLRLDRDYLVVAFKSSSRDVCERLLRAVNLQRGGKQQ